MYNPVILDYSEIDPHNIDMSRCAFFFSFWFEQLLLLWLARRSLKQEKYLTVMVIYMNTALMGNSMNGLCNFIFFLFPSAQIQIFFCFDEMLLVQIMI